MEDNALGALGAAPEPVPPADGPVPPAEAAVPSEVAPQRSAEQAERLVLELIAEHADSLLRVARRYSLCADDAQDAYQRTLEMLMRHAARLDADRAGGWLHTVVKREAVAVNKSRRRTVAGEEVDLDGIEVRTAPSPEDRVLGFERVARSAEALQRLKPHELRALWLKAMGNSYREICETTGWSYTKVNRCLAEGRKSFLARYAGIEAGEECERWAPSLSAMVDGEASAEQLVQLRPHLRNCGACQATVRELRGSSAPLSAVFPAGGLVLGAHGPLDAAGHLVARLWELVWTSVQKRAASTAHRAHSVAEAMTGGKAAAAAASVAAIAGGAIAVEGAVTEPARGARSAPTASAPAQRVAQALALPAPAAPAAAAHEPAATRPAATRRAATREPRERRRRRVHAATVSQPAPAPVVTTAPRAPAAPASAAVTTPPAEFELEQP
jgi:RNA polymerase sigma factor (sigma-70 family)